MDISFVTSNLSEDINEVISFAKKNNLRYIELDRINNKNITELNLEDAALLSSQISSAGILVSAIASPFLKWSYLESSFNICGQSVDSEEKYFTLLMDVADIFGASGIRIYSYLKDNVSIEELGQKLDKYSQMALDRGITLLLENDGLCNIDTISQMHQLFELYSFSNIAPLLDLGTTIALSDNFSPQELQDLINMCQYFHIKDYDNDLKRNVVIGEGNLDYEALLENKFVDNSTILSLNPHTGYPEDLQMSLNILQSFGD